MTNNGTATWSGSGDIYLQYTADLVNNGTFDVQNDERIYSYYSGSKTFTNNGLFRKAAGTGTTEIDVWFNNNGLVDVQTGTIRFDNGGTDTGDVVVADGATARWNGGTRTVGDGFTAGGNGRVWVSNGSVSFNGTADFNTDLQLSGGTLAINDTAVAGQVYQSGGYLSGGGIITATDVYTWSGGYLYDGGGTVVIGQDATLSIESGANKYLRNHSLINNGTAIWTDGRIYFYYTADIVNNGTFDVRGDDPIYDSYSGSKSFTNNGLFQKTAGTGTTEVDVWFNNNGVIDIQTGTVRFDNGGTDTGDVVVADGATARWNGGTRTVGDGFTADGNGRVWVSNGSVSFNGTADFNTDLRLSGGTLSINDTAEVGQMYQSGGYLAGSGVITATDVYTWSGGYLYNGGGTVVIGQNATLSIESGANKYLQNHSLVNNGTAIWTDGRIYFYYTADIVNNGTFDVRGDDPIYDSYSGSKSFTNNGLFQKTAGTGTTEIDVTFNNNGVIDIQTGTVRFDNGGTDTGDVVAAAGTTAQWNGGTRTVGDGFTADGNGRVWVSNGSVSFNGTADFNTDLRLSGGTLSINGPTEARQVHQSGGYLAGSGVITATDVYTWSGGYLYNGDGTVVIGQDAILSIESGANKYLQNHSLVNNGTAIWTDGRIYFYYAADIVNNGTFDVQSDQPIYHSYTGSKTFVNNGLLQKTAGTGTTEVDVFVDNTSGTIDVQTGTIRFDGGGNNLP